jgi:hypothetical protein
VPSQVKGDFEKGECGPLGAPGRSCRRRGPTRVLLRRGGDAPPPSPPPSIGSVVRACVRKAATIQKAAVGGLSAPHADIRSVSSKDKAGRRGSGGGGYDDVTSAIIALSSLTQPIFIRYR